MPKVKHDLSRREMDATFLCGRCGGKFFTPQGRANHRCKKGLPGPGVPSFPCPGLFSGAARYYKGKVVEAEGPLANVAAGASGPARMVGVPRDGI